MSTPTPKPAPPPTPSILGRIKVWSLRVRYSAAQYPSVLLWLIRRGSIFLTVSIVVYVAGAVQLGGWNAYDLLLGIQSPSTFATPILPALVSILGWMAAPAIIGAIAGYVVERQINRYRSQSFEQNIDRLKPGKNG